MTPRREPSTKKVSLRPVPYWRSALREKFSKNPLRDAVVLRPKKRARSSGHVVRRTPGPERTDRRFQRPALGSRRLEHGAPKRRRPQRYGRRRLRNKRHEKIALISRRSARRRRVLPALAARLFFAPAPVGRWSSRSGSAKRLPSRLERTCQRSLTSESRLRTPFCENRRTPEKESGVRESNPHSERGELRACHWLNAT